MLRKCALYPQEQEYPVVCLGELDMPDGLGIRKRVEDLRNALRLHLSSQCVGEHHAVVNRNDVVGAAGPEPNEEHLMPRVKERAEPDAPPVA